MEKKNKLNLRKFLVPEFIFGSGARFLAGRYAKNLGSQKVLVVTDPGIIQAGWTKDIIGSLEEEGLSYIIFSDVRPNPREEEVMKGAEIYCSEECNLILALGGGSPMDCAKGIGIVNSNKKNILEFEGIDEVSIPGPPLICIPTTAGSSADVSQFSIIRDTERKVKISIISKTVVPDVALIDPLTTKTMDSYLTACTGMDALCHAFEAYVSNASSPFTDLHALEAIRLISKNLLPAIKKPDNQEIREKMMLASLHAGLAFSNASLGAVHAMAHSLGGFLDFAHGEANAILLSYVIEFNFDAVPERYISAGEAMGLNMTGMTKEEKKKAIIDNMVRLKSEAGIKKTFGEIGMKKNDISELTEKALKDPCMITNPIDPNKKDIEAIYERAL